MIHKSFIKNRLLAAGILLSLAGAASAQLPYDSSSGRILAGQQPYTAGTAVMETPGMFRIGATGSTIYGFQTYRNESDYVGGWYEIEPNGNTTRKWEYEYGSMGVVLSNGWMANGRLCGLAAMHLGSEDILAAYAYQEIDPETGEILLSRDIDLSQSYRPYFYTTAFVPSENRIYGYGKDLSDGADYYFKSAPADRPEDATLIRKLDMPGERCYSMCYNSQDDSFYGVNTYGKLISINRDGTYTELFDVPVDNFANSKGALVYSPNDGYLLWNPGVYETISELYAIYPDEQRMERTYRFDIDCQFSFFVTPDDNFTTASVATPVYVGNTFEAASLQGAVKYRMPSAYLDGSAVSGRLSWTLYDNGTQVADGSAEPGEEINIPLQAEQGFHTYRLETKAGESNGYPGIAHLYIGHDTPNVPEDITLTESTISWQQVSTGVHNGYIDPSAVTYHVYLNDIDMGSTTSTTMPVNFDSDKIQDYYHAYVTATANGMTSEQGVSNKAIIGRPYPLPMTVVPTEHDGEMVTIINADGSPDYGMWRLSDQWGDLCFASGWSMEQPDDWLILPAADFPSNEVVYQVALEAARGGYIGQREYFEVWAGTEPTVEAMTIPVISKTRAQKFNDWKEYSGLFSVPRAGKYYIAVRSVSDPDQKDLIVRNIRITATETTAAVPAAVGNLSIVSTNDAELTATISFTMPEKYINGEDIAPTTVVTAKATAAATVSATGAPGSQHTLVVPTAQGDNYITVVTETDGIEGQKAEVSTFTGMDYLGYVENFNAEVSEDNMGLHLTWEPPLGSLNGGYVATTGIYYRIGQMFSDGSFKDDPASVGPDILEYDFRLPDGTPQQSMLVGVAAENAAGISPARYFTRKSLGTPHTLPIEEHFPDMTITHQVLGMSAPDARYADSSMTWCQPELVQPEYENPDIPFAIIGYTDAVSARVRISLPKVSTVGAESPTATLTIWNGNGAATDMGVFALTYGMETPEKIATITPGTGWQDVIVAIPEKYKNRPWITLYLDGNLPSPNNYMILGGYRISPMSGINGITANVSVATVKGGIVINGERGGQYAVYTAEGIRIAAGLLDGQSATVVATAPGIYIVRTNGRATSVIVR